MENASKALLIAAVVLIVIILISGGILLLTTGMNSQKQASEVGSQISQTTRRISRRCTTSVKS